MKKSSIGLPCDRYAPIPCENHTADCDTLFPEGCPWEKCGDYLTTDEVEDASRTHCEMCFNASVCKEEGYSNDSLLCEHYNPM